MQVASNLFVLTDLPEVESFLGHNVGSNMVSTEDGPETDILTAGLDWRRAADQVPRLVKQHLCNMLEVPSRDCTARAEACANARQLRKLLVLAADCVWVLTLVEPFLETLRELRAHVPWTWQMCVLLAYKSRSAAVDEALFGGLRREFELALVPELPGEKRGSVQLWVASARGGAQLDDAQRLSAAH